MAPRSRPRAAAAHALLMTLLPLASALAAGGAHGLHGRRLKIRPFMPGVDLQLTCRNTLLGPYRYADDKGMLCRAQDLDHRTGCCLRGGQFSCETCGAFDGCCESYESCVSCCQEPKHGAKERLPEVFRMPGKQYSGTWSDAFELCAAVCRTHASSTAHENSYISPRHHCFSKLGKPLLSPPLQPHALDGVSVVFGAAGNSCDVACAAHAAGAPPRPGGAPAQYHCSERHLPLLDTCDRLREHCGCEAGCVVEDVVQTMPYYADPDAPKEARPALCITGTFGGAALKDAAAANYSCATGEAQVRRLCPCLEGPKPAPPAPAPLAGAGAAANGTAANGTDAAGAGANGTDAAVVLSCDALAALPAGTAMEAELFELGPAAPELPPPETLPGTGGSQAPPELPLWPEAAAPPAAPEPAAPAPKQPRQRRQRRSQARKPGGAQPGATPVADGATLAGAGTACAGLWRYDSRRGERRLYRDQAALRAWGAPAPQSVACDVLALLSVGRPMPAAPPARRLAGDCGGDAAVLIPRGDGTFSLLAQAPQVRRSRRTGPPDA
ncbi:MAG: hypothetical protein J3K34DRAFT_526900 [Monoraphidium minutum]|nr:MAG: hypothetical protein J3K34DRAFT_526900 [Monoraphidium minutum]